jgi:GPH family glycoside/pentoside/hexuronide:cation symporter
MRLENHKLAGGAELPWGVKIAYGMGAIANAVKLRGLAMFLMLFYNQVLGLDPALVSGVIMITLVFDAVFDPLVGQASDRVRSPWGRRHPFMYFALIPYPLLFFFLWNPPALSDHALAGYLLVLLVSVRFFDTFFELPASALAPELATRYDDRTQLAAIRILAGTVGSVGVTALALNVFLKEQPDGTGGVLSREGYFHYSLAAGLVIFLVILICSLGTHSQIPKLSKAPTDKWSLRALRRDVVQTLGNRSFAALAAGGVLAAAGYGMSQALDIYWQLYFYRLSQNQILMLSVSSVVTTVISAGLATRLSRWFGKRNAAVGLTLISLTCSLTPLGLGLAGVAGGPHNLFPVLLPLHAVGAGAYTAALVMMAAMMMDIVEQVQLKTGRRSEGLLLSADALVRKITSGVGVLGSGLILAWASFPKGAERHEVPQEVLHTMAFSFIPLKITLLGACAVCLLFYTLTRRKHEENLNALRVPIGE